jgi:hypothetical protein
MNKRWGVLLAAGAALLSAALCLALFTWDNKYTRPGAQPINGLLILTERIWQRRPCAIWSGNGSTGPARC